MTKFSDLELAAPILSAVQAEGYTTPTPIQAQSITPLMQGKDLLGIAQTGTGKTAAFALPLLHRLGTTPAKSQPGRPRALILAPTRELAGQISDSLRTYGTDLKLRHIAVFGGTSIRPQISALRRGVHILVATPGRLLDLMNQSHVTLDRVETFILDEADRMLDMGFITDVKKIAATLPRVHQTVLFSATMPQAVQKLADGLLHNPVRVEVKPAATTAEKVDQKVMFVRKARKGALLSKLLGEQDMDRVLIFMRTKHSADRVAKQLTSQGVQAGAIHGNKTQSAREKALKGFRAGHIRALVATDIAARGIDVDGVTHVINYDLPNDPESYVHRIGRTARAGASGVALSFCDADERAYLKDIEKTIRASVPVIEDHPFHAEAANDAPVAPAKPKGRGGNKGRGGPRRHAGNGGAPNPGRPSRRPRRGGNQGGNRPAAAG